MSLREHVSLREHACVSSRGAQSTELVWILDFKQILLLLLLLGSGRVIYFIEKKQWGKFKTSYIEKHTNSPILSMLAINRNRMVCVLHSRM